MTTTHDLVIVGGGPTGLCCAWQAASSGTSTLVLDRFGFFNEQAGTSGAERHWRLQYTEEDLFRLTLQTAPLWQELESRAERVLIHPIGSLWFGDVDVQTNEGQISGTARMMDKLDVGYQWMTTRELERRFGFADLPDHYEGFLQPDGGTIDVRGTLAALYGLAQQAGADLRGGERAVRIVPDADGVEIHTDRGVHRAGAVVLAAGPWVNELLAPLGVELDVAVYEMALASLRRRDDTVDFPFWYAFQQPVAEDTNLFYGFGRNPWSPSELVRLGPVFEVDPLPSPDAARGTPDPRQIRRLASWVGRHLPALDPEPVHTSTCLAVLPRNPDDQFYLGPVGHLVPHGERVVVYGAGWGFKFAPLLGRLCRDLAVDGSTAHDVARLAPVAAGTR